VKHVRRRADPAVRALKAGKIKEALAELQPRLQADPTDPDTLFKSALAAQATNTKEGRKLAVEIMRDLSQRAPTADVWYNLGVAEARYANVLQAGEAFSESLKLRPDNVNALVALSALQWQVGSPKAGMVLHDRALELHQWHDPDQLWVISLIHLIRGRQG
jgi:tetratricopeptide (TPR) repeat protein